MFIKSLSIKNLLSYGDQPVTIEFDRNIVTVIAGKNGQGKSGIIEALTFVLYGKSFRDIKKDLLINNINRKNVMVECALIGNNGASVLIRRGLKPSIFEIYEDGNLVAQSAESKDYQLYLERNILGMNFVTYTQTVIISKTKYTPFMRLRAGERRQFVESILNLEIFSAMQKIHHKTITETKESIADLKVQIQLNDKDISNKNESKNRYLYLLDRAKKESEQEIQTEISQLESDLGETESAFQNLKSRYDKSDYSAEYKNYTLLSDKKVKVIMEITSAKQELKKLNQKSDICHVCGNKIDISHIQLHIDETNKKIESASSLLGKIESKMESLFESYEKYNLQRENNSQIEIELKHVLSKKKSILQKIEQLKAKTFNTSGYDSEISDIDASLIKLNYKKEHFNSELTQKLLQLDDEVLCYDLLKDSGIKASIIQDTIPSINAIINEYLHKFGFFIVFSLDSEFNETIRIRNIDTLVYDSFSEGEKLRVDLALIFAWRRIALLKNGTSCNLLFFDEMTDSSMDDDGVEMFMRCLNSLDDTNTFIISHTPDKMDNYARGFIRINKVNGFSTLS